jgi:hypothetical protein
MRFITEFEIRKEDENHDGWREHLLLHQRYFRQIEMGEMLAQSFEWKNPVNGNQLHHRLEIEAFPMDKWIEFKDRLMSHLTNCEEHDELPDIYHVLKMIKELESFGKPTGAAKQ